ncbi:MAG: hypothetical protein RQ864_06295 [Lutibacter sp.]|nr:hypothetical protein [Lutibacter sp.]
MKKTIFLTLVFLCSFGLSLEGCGPVVVTSRIGTPPPPWFYPNRAEVVRYIYFPDHQIYFDFSLRNYIFFDNGIWRRSNVLPPRYGHLNLKRSNRIRINNYFDDDIQRYHNNRSNINRRRSSVRSRN